MCSVRKGWKLYFDMVKKGERKTHRLSSAETPTLSRGSSHDVQISPWMSLHS
jgi:hypothetical protein